jgi:hypothetical protein
VKTNEHHIAPILFTPSDIPRDRSWEYWVYRTFNDVRDWYAKVLGGRTFRTRSIIAHKNMRTCEEYDVIQGGFNRWKQAMTDFHDRGLIDLCDRTHLYFLLTQETWGPGSSGMVGAENWGCSFIIPGRASTTGLEASVTGNKIPPPSQAWWFDERREAAGATAHEIAHALAQDMNHGTWEEPPSIMLQWWDFPNVGFRTRETERLLTEEVPTRFLVL